MSQKVCPKRAAVTESSIFPENKKQRREVTDSFGVEGSRQFHKMSSFNSVCDGSISSSSDGQTTSVSQSLKDNSSFGDSSTTFDTSLSDDLEDSGMKTMSNVDQVLVRKSGVPGFCLVQKCISLPKPRFDDVLSDTTVSLSDFSDEVVDKNSYSSRGAKTFSQKPETAVTEFSELEPECEFNINNLHSNTTTETVTTDSFKHADKLENLSVVPYDCHLPLKLPEVTATSISSENKGIMPAANEDAEVAANKGQTFSRADEKNLAGAPSTFSDLQTKQKMSARHKYDATKAKDLKADGAVHKQGNSSNESGTVNPRQKQSPLSNTKDRKRVQNQNDNLDCQTTSTSTTLGKKKRPSEKDSEKMAESLSEKAKKGERIARNDGRAFVTKKGKRTVLPSALLEGVVKTVQDNVRTISTQVVAASAEKPPCTHRNSSGKVLASTNTKVSPAVSACAKDKVAKVSSTKGNEADKKSKGRQKDWKQKTADNAISSERKIPHSDNGIELSPSVSLKQTRSKTKSREVEKGVETGSEVPVESVQTDTSSAKTNKKKARAKDHVQNKVMGSSIESENARLLSILPAYIPENDSGWKPKKENKKKRKSGGKRKLGGSDKAAENTSLLGVLPAYIPENDSRLRKKKVDKVYNLSELFSGTLGEGQSLEKRKRPNYFFAVQITDSVIKENLNLVLKEVEEAEPRLKPAFVPVEKAHITLAVLHLADQEAIDRAKAGLDDFQLLQQQVQDENKREITQATIDPLVLEIRGLGHFNDNVVFAKATEGVSLKRLQAIAESLRSCVLKQNLPVDDKGFEAHLTIMKISKNPKQLKKSGVKKISREAYKMSIDRMFGTELVTTVQLCSMLKPKQNNYYYIEHSVSLFDHPGKEGLSHFDGTETATNDGKEITANEDREPTGIESNGLVTDKEQKTTSDDNEPLTGDGRTPSTDDNKESNDGKMPPANDKKENNDGKIPSADDNRESNDVKTSSTNNKESSDGKTSTGNNSESSDGRTPSVDDNNESNDGETSSVDDNNKSNDGKTSSVDDNNESNDGKRLSTDDSKEHLTDDDERSKTTDNFESAVDEGKRPPSSNVKGPTADDGKGSLADGNKRLTTSEGNKSKPIDGKTSSADDGKGPSFDDDKKKQLTTGDESAAVSGKGPLTDGADGHVTGLG